MDVVLEIFDSLFFDYAYATLLPAGKSTIAHRVGNQSVANASYVNVPSGGSYTLPTPEFKPASVYLSLKPSKWAYLSSLQREDPVRQMISLYMITWIFGMVIYFGCAWLSYVFVFDKTAVKHPKFLKNQMRMEIKQAAWALPIMAILTVPFFFLEVRGYSMIYDSASEAPFPLYNWLQYPIFICFTDCFIYFIHRGLHHPLVYKRLHKPHHKWIVPTPFASHAFHPVDGWMQSLPYHIFVFVLPLQKVAYVSLFTFINIWTVMIHDGEYATNSPIINGAACHTMHHLYFNYNYGQFTTLWDRLGGSYRKPNDELFRREEKLSKDEWARQAQEMEKIVKEVEGSDERSYGEKKVQ